MQCREKQSKVMESGSRVLVCLDCLRKHSAQTLEECWPGMFGDHPGGLWMVYTEAREVSDTAWIYHVRSPDYSKDFGFYSTCDRKRLEV